MKKIIVVLLILFAGLFFFFSFSKADDLGSLSLGFCGQDDVLNYTLQPGTQTGICYELSNGGKNNVTVKLNFVDGTFTNDQRKNKACFADDKTQTFGQYVTGYQPLVTLKPGERLTGMALLQYPVGMNGLFHGCMTYSVVIPTPTTGGGTSFSIQMRRAKFIDIISGNPEELMKGNTIVLEEFASADGINLSSNSKIRIYKDFDDGYMIALKLKNVGVFDENLMITGVVSNFLTYKQVFTLPRTLTPGQSLLVTQKLITNPNYNLSLSLAVSHAPVVFGGMNPQVGFSQESAHFMIWNVITWLTLIGILVLILIVVLLVKDLNEKKKRRR